MADPKPKPTTPSGPSVFTAVHLSGFPCGAAFGRSGSGWGALTCPACIAIAEPTPTPPAAPGEE